MLTTPAPCESSATAGTVAATSVEEAVSRQQVDTPSAGLADATTRPRRWPTGVRSGLQITTPSASLVAVPLPQHLTGVRRPCFRRIAEAARRSREPRRRSWLDDAMMVEQRC